MKDDINLEELTKLAEQGDASAIRQLADYYYEFDEEKAIELYGKIVEQGDPDVQARLGYLYESCKNDIDKAVSLYTMAVESDNTDGQRCLACCYEQAKGVKQDYKKAIELYTKAAEKDDCESQYKLGVLYYLGLGCSEDYETAVKWYTKAAEQGHRIAQCQLGYCYESGEGVAQDYEKSLYWFRLSAEQKYPEAAKNVKRVELLVKAKSAEQGDKVSQCQMGHRYEKGIGVKQDCQKAVAYYRDAAAQGDVEALCHLARCYENGIGTTKDLKSAVELYKRAAGQGDAAAQCNLGRCFENGIGIAQDIDAAFQWYTKSAEQGYAEAQYCLAICYENGYGVTRSPEMAFNWYTKSAEQGHAKAQNNLGNCYHRGRGVAINYMKSIALYTQSAEQGYAKAQSNLGYCYKNGSGVPKDYVKAIEWFSKAAEQGETDVLSELGQCYQYGEGVGVDYAKAYRLYMAGVEHGNSDCMCFVGLLYYRGDWLPRSNKEAVNWWEKAAKLGSARAYLYLGYYYQTAKKIDSAVYWYSKAARKGVEVAIDKLKGMGCINILTAIAREGQTNVQYTLATYYQNGDGVEADLDSAIYWYSKAAENGRRNAKAALAEMELEYGFVELVRKAHEEDLGAQYDLAVRYAQGDGVNKDLVKAYKWYRKAAEEGDEKSAEALVAIKTDIAELAAQGNAGAIRIIADNYFDEEQYRKAFELYAKFDNQSDAEVVWRMGVCYLHQNNEAMAFDCFCKSANMDNAKAQGTVGFCYLEGWGVDIDLSKATEWFSIAALQGDADAQYQLAIFYFNGEGVKRNLQKAFVWFVNAGDQGHVDAQRKLGEYFAKVRIANWLDVVKQRGDYSKCNVGDAYCDGEDVKQNYEIAAKWYRQAAALGDDSAEKRLEQLYEEFLIAPENASKVKDAEIGELTLYGNNHWKGMISANFYGDEYQLVVDLENPANNKINDAQHKAFAEYQVKKSDFLAAVIAQAKELYKSANIKKDNLIVPKTLYIDCEGNYGWVCSTAWSKINISVLFYNNGVQLAEESVLYNYSLANGARSGRCTEVGDTVYMNLFGLIIPLEVKRARHEYENDEDEEIRNGKLTEKEKDLLWWLTNEFRSDDIESDLVDTFADIYENFTKASIHEKLFFNKVYLQVESADQRTYRPDIYIAGYDYEPENEVAICFKNKKFYTIETEENDD